MSKEHSTGGVKTYSRLLGYVGRYWIAFLLGVLGLFLHSAAEVAFVDLVGFITAIVEQYTSGDSADIAGLAPDSGILANVANEYFPELVGEKHWLLVPVFMMLIALFRGIGYLVGTYGLAYVSNYLVHALRSDLFEKFLRLPFNFFDQSMAGHLVSVVTFNVQQVTQAGTKAIKTLLQQGSLVIGLMSYLFYLNWKLTLIFIGVMPVIALIVTIVSKRFRRISKRIQSAMGDVTHVTQEAVNGYEEVRMFGGTEAERARMSDASHGNRKQNMKMALTEGISNPVVMLLVTVAFSVVSAAMLHPSMLSGLSTDKFVAFLVAAGMLVKPIRQLTEINSAIQKGIAAAESIFEILDSEEEKDTGTVELERVSGKFEFNNVNFKYQRSNRQILRNITFDVSPGETIALVGSSGSGKTTLVSLIPRFYNHGEGNILLDGVDVNDLSLTNLRKHISLVSQNVTLFNDTVFNNIAYGELAGASMEQVKEAARIAHADGFIEQLSEGYNTLTGDDGVMLSGGQRQRIAIARAVLKNAPVLILDEATSALDTDSERHIQAALEELMKDRTTFVIAHRLSTVEKADRILVMEQGAIIEQGSHQELLAMNGRYAQLYRKQFDEAEAG